MIGQMIAGKAEFKVRDTLGENDARQYNFSVNHSFNGKDIVINGHLGESNPVMDYELYRNTAQRLAKKGITGSDERMPDAPTGADFAIHGEMFFKEFEDVVILRSVHRTYSEEDDRVFAVVDPG